MGVIRAPLPPDNRNFLMTWHLTLAFSARMWYYIATKEYFAVSRTGKECFYELV